MMNKQIDLNIISIRRYRVHDDIHADSESYFIDKGDKLIKAWTEFNDKTVEDFGKYPDNYVKFTKYTVEKLIKAIQNAGYNWHKFDTIVLEETTASKQNYSQKKLEFLHYQLLLSLS